MKIKGQEGFTLVELMITMVVFVLAMVAASNIFTALLAQFKQQSSIAESNIGGISGLEMMRHDMELAGFGLPWNLNSATYAEAVDGAKYDPTNTNAAIASIKASDYNDATGNAPRAVVVGNNVLMNNSDILAIKATNVATNAASQKWEYIVNNGDLPNLLRDWGGSTVEKLNLTDHVIIVNPSAGSNVGNQKVLVNSSGNFDVTIGNGSFSFITNTATPYTPFEPPQNSFTAYIAYGVSPGVLRMPFNRADFYVKQPPDNDGDGWPDGLPRRCQPNTGILYKATINHADGGLTELPLLDCVLDMQVVVALDKTSGGSATVWEGLPADGAVLPAGLTAQQVRDQLKEIRVYLIVQDGQKDPLYTYVNPDTAAPPSDRNMVYVTDPNLKSAANPNGNVYWNTKSGFAVPDLNYRWKLQTIVITPYNLE